MQTNAENNTFCGDGAYDQWKVYETLAAQEIRPIIPPRKNAKIRQHGNTATEPIARDEAIRTIRREGRKQWKKEVNYHRRSLSETAMHRIKCCSGYKLKNHRLDRQRTEARLRCKIRNQFTQLGLPQFEWS